QGSSRRSGAVRCPESDPSAIGREEQPADVLISAAGEWMKLFVGHRSYIELAVCGQDEARAIGRQREHMTNGSVQSQPLRKRDAEARNARRVRRRWFQHPDGVTSGCGERGSGSKNKPPPRRRLSRQSRLCILLAHPTKRPRQILRRLPAIVRIF